MTHNSPVTGSFECGDQPSGSVRGREFINCMIVGFSRRTLLCEQVSPLQNLMAIYFTYCIRLSFLTCYRITKPEYFCGTGPFLNSVSYSDIQKISHF